MTLIMMLQLVVASYFCMQKQGFHYDEYYSFGNTDLYVSSGIGVSRVNFRLFNRS